MIANKINSEFEQQYILLRRKESRLFEDAGVCNLPNVHQTHPHAREWAIRKASMHRLLKYLKKKNRPLQVLEVGCGNGWLSSKLSCINQSNVLGIDVNAVELNQAMRVFANKENLVFSKMTLDELKERKFDIILFAASIQYFNLLGDVLTTAGTLLHPNGEIHIMDSPFYELEEKEMAGKRTQSYYDSLGCKEMNRFYHHHTTIELELFEPEYLYEPNSFVNRIRGNRNPFPWICIKAK